MRNLRTSVETPHRFASNLIYIHPPKQTWNLKKDPWKRRFLLVSPPFPGSMLIFGSASAMIPDHPSRSQAPSPRQHLRLARWRIDDGDAWVGWFPVGNFGGVGKFHN